MISSSQVSIDTPLHGLLPFAHIDHLHPDALIAVVITSYSIHYTKLYEFVYGLAWGVNNGILDKTIYLPVIEKAWKGLTTEALHSNGFLGYLQSTGKEPKEGQPLSYDKIPDFEDYGLGCFLLAGSEVYKLNSYNFV